MVCWDPMQIGNAVFLAETWMYKTREQKGEGEKNGGGSPYLSQACLVFLHYYECTVIGRHEKDWIKHSGQLNGRISRDAVVGLAAERHKNLVCVARRQPLRRYVTLFSQYWSRRRHIGQTAVCSTTFQTSGKYRTSTAVTNNVPEKARNTWLNSDVVGAQRQTETVVMVVEQSRHSVFPRNRYIIDWQVADVCGWAGPSMKLSTRPLSGDPQCLRRRLHVRQS